MTISPEECKKLQEELDKIVERQIDCKHIYGIFKSHPIEKVMIRKAEMGFDYIDQIDWFNFCPECGAQLGHTHHEMKLTS